jgi:hypothetical protein
MRYSAEKTRYEPGTKGVLKTVVGPRTVPDSTWPVSMSRSLVIRLSVITRAPGTGFSWNDSMMNLSLS